MPAAPTGGRAEGEQPLRYGSLWKTLGLGFVGVVIYLSLAAIPRELQVPGVFNAGHLFAYFWLMIWFAQIYRTRGIRGLWAMAFCALGVALELTQGMTGYRTFEYSDMVFDFAGVGLGLLLARTRAQDALAMFEAMIAARSAGRL